LQEATSIRRRRVYPVAKITRPNSTKFSVRYTCLWPSLGPPVMAVQYIMYRYFRFLTSCSHTMERMGQNQKRRVCFAQLARWRYRGEVCCLGLHLAYMLPRHVSDIAKLRRIHNPLEFHLEFTGSRWSSGKHH